LRIHPPYSALTLVTVTLAMAGFPSPYNPMCLNGISQTFCRLPTEIRGPDLFPVQSPSVVNGIWEGRAGA